MNPDRKQTEATEERRPHEIRRYEIGVPKIASSRFAITPVVGLAKDIQQ